MDEEMAQKGAILAEWLNSENAWGCSEESKQSTLGFILQLTALRENARKGVKLEEKERDSINAALRRYPWVLQLQGISSAGVPAFITFVEDESADEAQTWAKMAIDLTRANLLTGSANVPIASFGFLPKDRKRNIALSNAALLTFGRRKEAKRSIVSTSASSTNVITQRADERGNTLPSVLRNGEYCEHF